LAKKERIELNQCVSFGSGWMDHSRSNTPLMSVSRNRHDFKPTIGFIRPSLTHWYIVHLDTFQANAAS
jgi:hypothetical protein